ncbi:LacI family transcriptional regulator [Arthrobacter sp. RIT-PI-e]|uniref:LacI family DNA-binding transcriptional regulator n=1 Tax=Arthrobacter sp. RIT-PI-e TaxID=1681197 RepID=UPI000675F98D|nr:LacI family DNA-binding transcriptional regulator [Arthrobacter sp. RIT-PI-e]KNC15067.1 LacI family transcriptional regulator [Arthrobacter sp. RIT-PI-e]
MNTSPPRSLHQVPGRPSPTLEDLALAAGVSRSTASRAINGGDRVSPEARAAVDRAVADLGYIPNRAARSLVTRRTSSIALVIPEPDVRVMMDPFFAVVITGITEALRETDVQLVLLMSRTGDDSARTLRYLRGGHVDGAIVVSHHRADSWARSLSETGLPTIFIGRPWDTASDVTYVDTDNEGGGRLAARHLAGIGRRRLATVAGPADMTAAVDRLRGWQAGLRDAGLPEGPVVHADFTTDGAAAAARQLLTDHPDVDGIFAASDLMALGVLEAVHASGRTVPGDIALMGYDNHAVAGTASTPLTSITQSIMQMAVRAGAMLLEEIEAPGSHPEPVVYSTELVERASTMVAPRASAVKA